MKKNLYGIMLGVILWLIFFMFIAAVALFAASPIVGALPEWHMTRQFKADQGPCSSDPKWQYKSALEPEVLQDGTWKVQVWFRNPDEVAQRCKGGYGCAFENVKDPTYKLIIISRPASWNDRSALCIVGHEMMHVFGGEHE